jgi:serine protease Do
MRLASFAVSAVLLTVFFCLAFPANSIADTDEPQPIISAVERVAPSLVRIRVVSTDDQDGRDVKVESFGSGVIISKDGFIITNHHVAGHARQIFCTLADKSELDAYLVGTDPATDIAVIKLKPALNRKFSAAVFGDSSALKVGDPVLAMGSPLAFSQSVTMGIISNTELIMPDMFGELTLDGEDVGSLVRWIGHDAMIQHGNSGGPLVNMKGEIVGINELNLGLSGAIPGNLAKEVAEALILNGRVTRSWMGLILQPILKTSASREGVLIAGTVGGSPARAAGFASGDILLRLAGRNCSVRYAEEMPVLNQFLQSLPAAAPVEAVIRRGDKDIIITVTPVEKEKAFETATEFKEWGFCASNITFFTAKEKMRTGTSGVLVTSLRAGGPAADAKPGLAEGDVITAIAGKPVKNIQDLKKITRAAMEGKEQPMPLTISFDRNADNFITVVKLGMEDLRDPGFEVRKAWIPVNTQVLTRDIAEEMGLKGKTGVRVVRVYSNAPGKTDLKVGDIITAIDNAPIPASEPEDSEVFPTMVRQYKAGSTLKLNVIRGGKEIKVQVTPGISPKLAREMRKYRDDWFDLTVRDICFFDRVDRQWAESQMGVIVESADEGGWASLSGLQSGDLITVVDGESIKDAGDFQKRMQKISAAKQKTVVLQVKRGIYTKFIEIEPVWTPE